MSVPPVPEPTGPVAPIEPGLPPAAPEQPLSPPAAAAAPITTANAEAAWKPWASLVGFFGGFAAAIFGTIIISAFAGTAHVDDQPTWARIAGVVVQDLCLIGVAAFVARLMSPARPWSFGLRRPPNWLHAVGWFAVAYVAFIVFSAAWIGALGLHNEKDTLPTDFHVQDSTGTLIAVAVMVCVVAPFAEEFFFRGFFFRALVNWKGVWPAAILTGVAFGAVHLGGSPIGFIVPLGFLGFALCILYWKTRSLLPCMALHCINNCIAYGNSSAVGWTWQIPVAIVASLAIIGLVLLLLRRIAGPPPGPMAPFAAARNA